MKFLIGYLIAFVIGVVILVHYPIISFTSAFAILIIAWLATRNKEDGI